MRFTGVLVRPLHEQGDRDNRLIDPVGVAFDPEMAYPLFADFDYSVRLGECMVRAEGGQLVVEGEIDAGDPDACRGLSLAAGVAMRAEDVLPSPRMGVRVISACRLNAVSLTGSHADPGQPAIEFH